MGSENNPSKKRYLISSSSSSSSEDGVKNKRRRSSETKSDKKEKESHRKSKSRKSSKHRPDSIETKAEEKHKHKSRHHKHGRRIISNFKEISGGDYFSKNNEFATWLKEGREMFFSDLSSESARKLFSEFVDDWNNKKLESKYYEGISTGPRSSHNWKIKVDDASSKSKSKTRS